MKLYGKKRGMYPSARTGRPRSVNGTGGVTFTVIIFTTGEYTHFDPIFCIAADPDDAAHPPAER